MLRRITRMFGREKEEVAPTNPSHPARLGKFGKLAESSAWPRKSGARRVSSGRGEWVFSEGEMGGREFRIRLYRFLRDYVPLLRTVIWTWTRLVVAPHRFEFLTDSAQVRRRARKILDDLDRRIYPHPMVRYGGFDALLIQFFNSLFTDGATAGEVILHPSGSRLDRLGFIDVATLDFSPTADGSWRLYQQIDEKRIPLTTESVYYYPLDAEANSPHGKSLLGAVSFISRIEQELIADMRKAMHNAGYHRLHVKIAPPEKSPSEHEDDYVTRANNYFDRTLAMMRDFDVDDNPVTWNDVTIEHIGPSSQVSSATNWYLNHKAMVEDIVAGCHLAPFMLGYSYGATQNWAQFKYDMVQRQIFSLQRIASHFLEWIANIELALHGIQCDCRHVFDNRVTYGLVDKLKAEQLQTDILIRQIEHGLLTKDEAREKLLATADQ